MKKISVVIIIVFFLTNCLIKAQESPQTIDSLLNVLNRLSSNFSEIQPAKGSDTTKVIVLNRLGKHYRITNEYTQAIAYSNEAKNIAHKEGYLKGEAHALSNIGIIQENIGNYDSALFFLETALKLREKMHEKRGCASSYHSIGVIYVKKGNYEKAMQFYLKSIRLLEEIGDKKAVGISYNNIGNIFFKQNNFKKALENYQNSLKIQLETGDKEGLALVYGNLASVYLELNNYSEALVCCFKSIEFSKAIGDHESIAFCYNNIATVYEYQGDYSSATDYQFKSLEIVLATGNKELIATAYKNIGDLYEKTKKYTNALIYGRKALEIFKTIGNKEGVQSTYYSLSSIYSKLNNYQQALVYQKLYVALKDSILNESSNKQIAEMNTKYESEKKEKNIQMLIKDKEIQETEIAKQKLIKNLFIIGFVVTIIISLIVFQLFRTSKRQKVTIEQQNNQIVESINYSKLIQNSLLPAVAEMKIDFPNLFILNEPKNIVSGDFYYFKQFDNYTLIACVDCTGHGVPGGFMSTLGSLLLDKIVNNKAPNPSYILTQLNNEISRLLNQKAGVELNEAMDLSICLIDKQNLTIEFVGAKNGIVIVSNNIAYPHKANPISVGGNYIKKEIPLEHFYLSESIQLKADDWVFMYTDGFIEQIGGSDNTHMNSEQFYKYLTGTTLLNTAEQKVALLKSELKNWSGNNEQTDDILIIGFQAT